MKIQEFAKHLDEPREIGKKKQKVSSSDMKKLKNKAFEVYKEISTSFKPEKRRKLKPGEIEIMKGRGNRQVWFYVNNKTDAKTLIRLGRNTAFPTGITNNNSKDKFDKNLFIKEDWSNKYKKSIDCNNPKGFSQKAHCDGKKKKESKDYTFGPDWIPTSLAQRKKMKRIHRKLNRSIREDINIPVKIGDTILTGRFKNKKTVVKSIDKDEHGMPTINGRKVVTFRIPVKESSQVTNAKGVKGYSSFVELGFEKEYYKHMENILTRNGETMILKEGINDPGILKAVFLAGGPGSGKTWVAKGLFGIPERVNVSQTGMKMVNTDKELKFLLKKYGFGTDLDALPDEVFDNLTGRSEEHTSELQSRLHLVCRLLLETNT